MCLARHSDTQSVAGFPADQNPDNPVHRRREPKYVQILSHNTRGFSDEKEEMVVALMEQNFFLLTLFKKLGNAEMLCTKSTVFL